MKILFPIILCLLSVNAFAFKPGHCHIALDNLLEKLIIQNKLANPSKEPPQQGYFTGQLPNLCLAFKGEMKDGKSWATYMNSDNSTVIFESTEIGTSIIKNYYGPFYSAYKK